MAYEAERLGCKLPDWQPKYNWVRQYDREWRALAAQNQKHA
jgi:hypothetical protein